MLHKRLFVKSILLISAVFLLSASVSADAIIRGSGGGSPPAEPFFAADWTTNIPGATDETCSAAGGCPDIWDVLTDTGGFASVSSGALAINVTAATNSGHVSITNGAGDILEDFAATEIWVEFELTLNNVVDLGAIKSAWFVRYNQGSAGELSLISISTDASGDIYSLGGAYRHDLGSSNFLSKSWTPAINTKYYFRAHIANSTGAGNNDGVAEFWADTELVSTCAAADACVGATNIDSDTIGALNLLMIGNRVNMYDGTNPYQYLIDNFELYTTDPAW